MRARYFSFAAALALPLLVVSLASAGEEIAWPTLGDTPPGTPGTGRGDAAIVVAIEEYDQLPWVLGAEHNGQDWVGWLNRTRGIQLARVRQVFGGATVSTIRDQALEAARDVRPGGTLWFVFIGHGAPAPGLGGSVLVGQAAPRTEAALSDRSYVLLRDELLDELSATLPRDAWLVAVLDACFSGQDPTGQELVPGLQASSYRADSFTEASRRTLFVATSQLEYAGNLPGSQRPAFSYLLLGALRGWADDPAISGNGDGHVTDREAISYAETALRTALRGRRNQTPRMLGSAGALDLSGIE